MEITNFKSLVDFLLTNIANPLVVLVVALALVYFLAGVLKYLKPSAGDNEREEARKHLTFGIIALFVMVSVWGLVRVLKDTFQLEYDSPPSLDHYLD